MTTKSGEEAKRKIGIIGCGNIAALMSGYDLNGDVVAVFDRHEDRAGRLAERFGARAYTSFETFIQTPFDLVMETASVEAVRMFSQKILEHDNDLLILSAGALADEALRATLIGMARYRKKHIYVPSGAFFGLDNAKIARLDGVETLTVRTTKSPDSLGVSARTPQRVFAGSVAECIKRYPRNVNAAVALSLAARKEVQIELWADPDTKTNTHELLLEGRFGKMHLKVENVPSPDHPSTSVLAALSIVALLEDMDSTLCIGT